MITRGKDGSGEATSQKKDLCGGLCSVIKGVLNNFVSATVCPFIEANGNNPKHNPIESVAPRGM